MAENADKKNTANKNFLFITIVLPEFFTACINTHLTKTYFLENLKPPTKNSVGGVLCVKTLSIVNCDEKLIVAYHNLAQFIQDFFSVNRILIYLCQIKFNDFLKKAPGVRHNESMQFLF